MNVLVGIAAAVYTLRNIGPVGWLALVLLSAFAICLVWLLWVYFLLAAGIVLAVWLVSSIYKEWPR